MHQMLYPVVLHWIQESGEKGSGWLPSAASWLYANTLVLTVATSRFRSSAFPTWHTVPDTLSPSCFSAATVLSTFCCFRLLMTTWAPSWARRRAMAKPILRAERDKNPRL